MKRMGFMVIELILVVAFMTFIGYAAHTAISNMCPEGGQEVEEVNK